LIFVSIAWCSFISWYALTISAASSVPAGSLGSSARFRRPDVREPFIRDAQPEIPERARAHVDGKHAPLFTDGAREPGREEPTPRSDVRDDGAWLHAHRLEHVADFLPFLAPAFHRRALRRIVLVLCEEGRGERHHADRGDGPCRSYQSCHVPSEKTPGPSGTGLHCHQSRGLDGDVGGCGLSCQKR
jgi:hypothetical protein